MQSVADTGGGAATKPSSHVLGLDGLRGFALIVGPLLFHLWPGLVPGGVLSIDMFFVLSAFLITRLGLREIDRRGKVDVGGYTNRRLRRLTPVLVLTVGAVVLWAAIEPPELLDDWIGGAVASLFGVENWFLIAQGESYFSFFGQVSPLRHLWSLSIEMQFYVFAPMLLVIARQGRRRSGRITLLVVAAVGAVASAWWMSYLYEAGTDPTRVYFGTDTRAQGLLVGVALAVAVELWGPVRSVLGRRAAVVGANLAVLGHIVLVASVSEEDTWLYEYGGFLLAALMGALMAFGALQPINRGPAFWILESKPAVWLGKVSYGLYLYHWPIILFLTPERTGLDGNALAAYRLAVSLAVTALSWYLIEQPVLRRKPAPWPMAFATVTSMAVIFVGLLWVTADRPPEIEQIIVAAPAEPGDETGTTDDGGDPDATAAAEGGDDPATTVPVDRPFKLLVVGDSVPNQVVPALREQAEVRDLDVQVFDETHIGCVITRYGDKRPDPDNEGPVGDVCSGWADPVEITSVVDPEVVSWPTAIEAFQPDAVLLYTSAWDASDRRIPSLGPDWVHAGQEVFDEYALSEYELAADTLTESGATLYWMLGAPLNRPVIPQNDPERIERLNELVLEAIDGRENIEVVDYPAFIGPVGGERDERLRGDGLHLSPEGRDELAAWLYDDVFAMDAWTSSSP